ncbi:MAG: NAD(P)H-dependent oxidoreductase subunit E [Bacilli bacterium]|nr:NAD(P)H-dependent oxidoreductase subunit E [Bacilli bacterium]MBN2876857.1 NAD(P)H-dependent oxidoreductase subunit E [Bacilli bacterium]
MLLKEILSKYPKDPEYLIEILLEYQTSKKNHYISPEDVSRISGHFDIPESQVCSVISFYTLLSMEPKGRYVVQICHDVPCFVNDATNIYEELVNVLGIKEGETTPDNLFTLEITECLGCCNEAPAMRVNNQVYTNLTPAKIEKLIKDLRGEIK